MVDAKLSAQFRRIKILVLVVGQYTYIKKYVDTFKFAFVRYIRGINLID
jgi:hypothetical protein